MELYGSQNTTCTPNSTIASTPYVHSKNFLWETSEFFDTACTVPKTAYDSTHMLLWFVTLNSFTC